MKRLTMRQENGEAGVYLYSDPEDANAITQEMEKKQKEVMARLAVYEDTGLTPEEIMDSKMLTGWITCSGRLPKAEKEVLVQANRDGYTIITTAIYENGKMSTEDSIWNWYDIDFEYLEEEDTYLIPEGWWEYRHYNPDDVYNCVIDDIVVAWQPLP